MHGLALILFPLLLNVCGACTGGWHSFRHGGPCFKIFHEREISWNIAHSRCQNMGTVLAQVPDHSTHTHLINLISSTHSASGSDEFFMVGATNWGGSWRWEIVGTSLPGRYSGYWVGDNPDNYCKQGHTCHEGQHCVAYTNKNNNDDYAWDDITCSVDNYNYYICEKNAEGHSGPIVG
ncbi:uncharacterized protein LOC117333716 [Pecten maximus]|uniref:uncharacterized protein LOC117333716 n=1 Tax=Pecten maximus TaxID=6579 RepID=UPI0014591093|nr:uncharacterized protein LOC117333716 [Pecten maximus]